LSAVSSESIGNGKKKKENPLLPTQKFRKEGEEGTGLSRGGKKKHQHPPKRKRGRDILTCGAGRRKEWGERRIRSLREKEEKGKWWHPGTRPLRLKRKRKTG